jgi:hypothetical protein
MKFTITFLDFADRELKQQIIEGVDNLHSAIVEFEEVQPLFYDYLVLKVELTPENEK